MAKSKKKDKTPKNPSVKIEDLTPSSNPAGGFSKISIEYKEQKPTTAPIDSNITIK